MICMLLGVSAISKAQYSPFDDTDGDGILNRFDWDNDNDGIRDRDERHECSGSWINLVYWYANSGSSTNYEPTYEDSDLSANDIVFGSGWSSYSTSGTFLNMSSGSLPQDLASAISGNYYIEYKAYPGSGKSIDIRALYWNWTDFTNTPKMDHAVSVFTDLDSFQTDLVDSIRRPNTTANQVWETEYMSDAFMYDITDSVTMRVYLYAPTIGGTPYTSGTMYFDDFQWDGYHMELDDCDGDGVPNIIDLDSDNDGVWDAVEAGHHLSVTASGRISGAAAGSGANGLYDSIETTAESGSLNYSFLDSDGTGRDNYLDLDSDDDGCTDAREVNLEDKDFDSIPGNPPYTFNADGMVTSFAGSYSSDTLGLFDPDVTACKPTASSDSRTLAVNDSSIVNVLINDSHPQNDTLNIGIVTGSAVGATVSVESNRIKYIAPPAFIGLDSVEYSIEGPLGFADTSMLIIDIATTLSDGEIVLEITAASPASVVDLNWTHSIHPEPELFKIERSKDAANWVVIGAKEAGQEAMKSVEFDFTDENPIFGSSYYRVRSESSVFADVVSNVVGSKRVFEAFGDVQIKPNPVGGKLWLEGDQISNVRIYRADGALVRDLGNRTETDLSDLPSGIYMLHAIQNEKAVSKRILKK